MIEIWVRWRRVNRFTASESSDRHYVLDRATGKLMFGDGVNGLVPSAGKANINAARYRSGGGHAGNRGRGTISVLRKTYPLVDSVTNHQPASGGMDQEDLDQVMARGPHTIKNRGRAVTVEDFEWIGRQASGEVARARCLANTRVGPSGELLNATGRVTLVVVPDEPGDRPMPVDALLSDIKASLTERCLASLAEHIDVVGPSYIAIAVDATIAPRPEIEEKIVQQRVDANLRSFLHPLRGGGGTGWEFGRSVSLSEIMRVVRTTEGVDRVLRIGLRSTEGMGAQTVALPASGLPCSGDHLITIARS